MQTSYDPILGEAAAFVWICRMMSWEDEIYKLVLQCSNMVVCRVCVPSARWHRLFEFPLQCLIVEGIFRMGEEGQKYNSHPASSPLVQINLFSHRPLQMLQLASFPGLCCLIPRPQMPHSQALDASFPGLCCLIPRSVLPSIVQYSKREEESGKPRTACHMQ